jgi:hypothetical protein
VQHQVNNPGFDFDIEHIGQIFHCLLENLLVLFDFCLAGQTGDNQMLQFSNFRDFVLFGLVGKFTHDIDVKIVIFEGFGVLWKAFDDVFEILVGGFGLLVFLELGSPVGGSEVVKVSGDG